MAVVRPFRGLRPRPDVAHEVASPPYDVLSVEEARRIARDNPNNFLHVNKAELEFDGDVDPYGEEVYGRARQNLARLIREGILVRDEMPAFYLYRLGWQSRSQTGLVALTSVDEYNRGLIRKHEHTRPEKVADRASHIAFLQAQVGPVFSTFRNTTSITSLFERMTAGEPETAFTANDTVRHELWCVSDTDMIRSVIEAFRQVPVLYIADGHHRSAAAAEVARKYLDENPDSASDDIHNFFLNVIFADNELSILPYHRVVRDLRGLSLSALLERVSSSFVITAAKEPVEPSTRHEFGLYSEGTWNRLVARPESFDASSPTGSIDTAILADNLIAPILGISDPRTDKRIDFVGGIRGIGELIRLVDSGEYAAAFSLYPTTIDELLMVADAGDVMPPKSTWFEPKLRSGMVVNLLTE